MITNNNHLVLLSLSITGTNVYNARDEKLGDIKDIMINTQSASVSYAVLSVSDGLFSNKYFAVPLEAMRFDTAGGEKIILDVREDWLDNAPGFDKDHWPTSADDSFVKDMHSFYKTESHGERTTTGTTV